MNKLQLIDTIANKHNMSKKDAAVLIESIFGEIENVLKRNDEINIGGFGAFRVKTRPARVGINPKTGEKIDIAESKIPSFRPSKALKDEIK